MLLRLGFCLLRVRRFRLVFLCSAHRAGRPMPKLGSLRSKLAAFKYPPEYTSRENRPAGRRAGPASEYTSIWGAEKASPAVIRAPLRRDSLLGLKGECVLGDYQKLGLVAE